MFREVNLIEHLPLFIQVYREIGHIMTAENPEFQLLADESEKIKDNQFITTCNLEGIARFEKLLHITPSPDDTLESRISRVLIRWNDIVPYTWKVFLRKLDTLCGVGNYEVIPNFNEYMLKIITHINLYGQVDELDHMLSYMIPANIVVISNNVMERQVTGQVFTGATVVESSIFTITSQTTKNHSLNANAFTLGVIGTNIERIIN